MNNHRKLLVLAATLLFSSAQAQAVYRCGSTYSDSPCGQNAKQLVAPRPELRLLPDNPPSAEQIAANMATCERKTRAKMKDPDAAKITPIGRIGPVMQYVRGQRVQGVSYHIAANSKNSYGGYTGEKLYVCGFDAEEKTLVFSQETDRAPR